jgi:hypothetical protein
MIKVRIVIMSHLNDAAIDMEHNPYMAHKRLEFVKELLYLYPDTSVKVDEDYLSVLFYEFIPNITGIEKH